MPPSDIRDEADPLRTDELIVELYRELRTIARREHFRAGMPPTLQTTALIGEAYMKLQRRQSQWESRNHFLACAATAMRHVLVDAARARLADRRTKPDDWSIDLVPADDPELVRLGDALASLSEVDPELARMVDCRFFAGYDERETAEILGVSDRTVRRRWVQARAWIHAEMAG